MIDEKLRELEREVRADPGSTARVLLTFARIRANVGFVVAWEGNTPATPVFWMVRQHRVRKKHGYAVLDLEDALWVIEHVRQASTHSRFAREAGFLWHPCNGFELYHLPTGRVFSSIRTDRGHVAHAAARVGAGDARGPRADERCARGRRSPEPTSTRSSVMNEKDIQITKPCARGRPCAALAAVLSEPDRTGLSFPLIVSRKTGKARVGTLLFRIDRARAIFCNFCPFCGVDQDSFARAKAPRRERVR